MKLNWNFQRGWEGGGGEVLQKIPSVGVRYGYFLELHVVGGHSLEVGLLLSNLIFLELSLASNSFN